MDTAITLFRGRIDAIGTEEGGAERLSCTMCLWESKIAAHFDGTSEPCGVYPMIPYEKYTNDNHDSETSWVVHWGCIDYDEGDEESLIHAKNTQQVLKLAAGITSWVEKSRSKGYHVWVFADQAIEAIVMRRALLAAAQIVDAPMKEINPKQISLPWVDQADARDGYTDGNGRWHAAVHAGWKLGNYVRLPYPGGIDHPAHNRNVLHDNIWMDFESFVTEAWANRCTNDQLIKMGSKFIEPPKRERTHKGTIDTTRPWRDRLDPLTFTMMYGTKKQPGGPLEDKDRSGWLWRLANNMVEKSALEIEEMVEAMTLTHDTYMPEKFGHRAEEEMERMLDKVLEMHE